MMNITREDLIRRIHEESGYYNRDIRKVLQSLDKIVLEYFQDVDYDNDLIIQIIEGIKITGKLVEPRERIHPSTREVFTVGETIKPGVKFTEAFKKKIQNKKD